jgi:hypothetical protein
MKGAQVAVCDYAPARWAPGTACVVRRVKIRAGDISTDARARPRRTIPKEQLALALDGLATHVDAYSFIATNLDVSTAAKAVAVEAWHRMRTDIEDRIRDAKHGAALRRLPSASRAAKTVWMWAALLAVNLSAWLQELTGLDGGDGRGRAHLGTLRHGLLTVPARLIRHAGQVTLRLPQANNSWPRSCPGCAACRSGPDHPPHRPEHSPETSEPGATGLQAYSPGETPHNPSNISNQSRSCRRYPRIWV